MKDNEGAGLRRELQAQDRGRGKRYPVELKARATAYAKRRHDAGASYAVIAGELGLGFETVRRWCSAAEPTPLQSALVPVEVVAESRESIAIVSPSGFRLEGLDVAEAVAALRALR